MPESYLSMVKIIFLTMKAYNGVKNISRNFIKSLLFNYFCYTIRFMLMTYINYNVSNLINYLINYSTKTVANCFWTALKNLTIDSSSTIIVFL